MKTTIDISGSIRIKAKRLARDQNTTLRSLAEEGLIKVIEERSARRPYRVNPVTFRGKGLSPEFPAVATHPRMFNPPSPVLPMALEAMEVWLASPSCGILVEGPDYFETLRRIVAKGKTAGAMVHDSRIAALCLHHGVRELRTADRDFSRFPELRTRNPLA